MSIIVLKKIKKAIETTEDGKQSKHWTRSEKTLANFDYDRMEVKLVCFSVRTLNASLVPFQLKLTVLLDARLEEMEHLSVKRLDDIRVSADSKPGQSNKCSCRRSFVDSILGSRG